jgi:hypothetical protein
MEPYRPRAFRFIELCRFGKWQMQLYGIADQGEFPRTELLAAAKKIAAIELAKFKPIEFTSDLLAYTMDAMRRLFLSVSGETRTSFFTAYFFPGGDKFADLSPAGDSDPSVCVWDLALQSFERAAWIKHVLLKADAPDFAGYLSDRRNFDL